MKNLLALIMTLLIFYSHGQNKSSSKLDSIHIEFLEHLKKENLWKEGLHFLNSYAPSDKSHYFKGLFYYHLEQVDSSIFYFNNVTSNATYWDQSKLLSSFQLAYKNDLIESKRVLESYSPKSDLLKNVKSFQYAGTALLERDLNTFKKYENNFSSFYQLAPYENVLMKNQIKITELKHKSPLAAGLLSAIVPGAGRFYMGRSGEGIATLLVTSIFALQAREAYMKDGLRSPRFIIFGSLLSITYVSNIWGSVLSVKVVNLEKNNQINEDILLNMHIPLRVLFD